MRIVQVQERHPVLIHALLDIWERSVRATHLFLSDGEIESIKEYVPRALMGVENLTVAENEDGRPVAFMGTESGTLEMLFIAPEERGKGLGKRLLRYGIDHLEVKELAVNEQNPQAKGFYEHINGRSATSRAVPTRFCTCACGRKMAFFRSDAGREPPDF